VEEFTFGTLATDDLKLLHHRVARRGIHHAHDLSPRDPLPDQPVTITVRVGPDLSADHVACYYTVDGTEPTGARGTAHNGRVLLLEPGDVTWDTLLWGYLTTWRGTLPPQPEGTVVSYRVGAWAGDAPEVFADWPDVQAAAERAAEAFFRNEPLPAFVPEKPGTGHVFTYHVDRLGPPDWARQAVIYQVFVDRFWPGQGRPWLADDVRALCGGTLWGVLEKLGYIADLGATCIWLSPIFPSPTHHGYDATDLLHVEPRLGGDEALRALVEAAHARGMRILLDLVCNHISDQHPVFQDALNNPDGPHRDWFIFDDSPVGYRAFFAVPSMPQINVANPAARRWLIDTACYWLREFDVDGFRLDYANGPGPDFWGDFWAACKAQKPDCLCFGEIVDMPEEQIKYVGRLDGCLDFFTADMLRRVFGQGSGAEADFARAVARHRAYMPDNFLLFTFVDNHDMDRFLYLAGGDKDALRRAAAAQMCLPAPPIIYQGTEIGLNQPAGKADGFGLDANRVLMIWDERQDRRLLEDYKALIRGRRR